MAATSTPTIFTYNSIEVPIFEGEYYNYWSYQMQTLFISQELWDIVDGTYPEPLEDQTSWQEADQKQYKKNIKRDASALRYIQQGVSNTIFPRIFGAKKAKEAWDILKKDF